MLALALFLQADAFFEKPAVDFWNARQEKEQAPALPPDPTWTPPPEVQALLESPTPENARRYLDIQAERLRRIRKAMEAVQAEAAKQIKVRVYTMSGCPACDRQRQELKTAPWPVEWLAAPDDMTSFPTLVIQTKRGPVTRKGFQTLDDIQKEISRD